MPVHAFLPGASLDAVVATVVVACKRHGLSLTIELGASPDGVELRSGDATPTHVSHLARSLGASHPLVQFADCTIAPGSRGEQLSATGVTVKAGELEEADLTEAATAILHEWSEGAPVHEEELVAGLVAAALLERDPDDFHPAKVLRLKPKRGSRVDELATALRAGATYEWTTVGDRLALRIQQGGGNSRVAALSDEEAAAIRAIIETLP
jgi:hypothetical protein